MVKWISIPEPPAGMLLLLGCLGLLMLSCGMHVPQGQSEKTASHALWDSLLKKHVTPDGWVDYWQFKQDEALLDQYLVELSANPPAEDAGEAASLAYWINAYNAYTIKLILRHYPVNSIKGIGFPLQIPFVNSVFDRRFIRIGDEKLDLNFIEHQVLRKRFQEPRIHFAIVCASVSCPELRNEAYTAEKLEAQLQEQATGFLQDPLRNRIGEKKAGLSKIFSWFSGDFTKEGDLVDFINRYLPEPLPSDAEIEYLDYNWQLNSLENRSIYTQK